MQTSEAPPQEKDQDNQLEQFQAVVAQLSALSGEIDNFSANIETQLHNLSNTIGQQNLEIRALQEALPDPAPIFEENVLNEHPPAAREPSAQPNQAPQTNITAQSKPQTASQGQGKEPDETIDLQLLAKRLTVIETDLRALPTILERAITATLFSSVNPKKYLPHAIGVAIALSAIIAGSVVTANHFSQHG
ncbi:MAG: hypothetical protein HC780_29135 [Leptolyngbyaceae cyanobacterium CSU_1_3]|nr:hypothetical protein [Leptolyngbyaceae cyanobacterium CSU_1_3]